ncbi:MAG: hypothetical protein F6J86_39940, partial [Symploca sp. SIO1B1]|nr:hypothetical protein [Symploca sp. SIO1B1]
MKRFVSLLLSVFTAVFLVAAPALADTGLEYSGNGFGVTTTDTVDAGVVWNNGKAYFFNGTQYDRYDIKKDRVDPGYPASIINNWHGWPENFMDIDAGVVWDNGKAYFFKGSEYIRYDIKNDRVDPGYPASIINNWHGWPENFMDIDAGVVWDNGKAYFFKGS